MKQTQLTRRAEIFVGERIRKSGTINAMLQMTLDRLDEEHDSIILRFPIEAWELNPAGTLHGGILSTMVDIAMGCSCYIHSEAFFTPTAQMAVQFIRPVFADEVLYVEGYCDHAGSRLAQARAIVRRADGEMVASASGTYVLNDRQG